MRGTVVRYDAIKGYAFVEAEGLDGDVFLHVNDIKFDKTLMAVGTVVEMTHEMGDRGPRAIDATLVSSPVADAVQAALGSGATVTSPAPAPKSPPADGVHDGYADVLSAAELRREVTEKLLSGVSDLTGRQVLAVRTAVEQVARGHGWLDDRS